MLSTETKYITEDLGRIVHYRSQSAHFDGKEYGHQEGTHARLVYNHRDYSFYLIPAHDRREIPDKIFHVSEGLTTLQDLFAFYPDVTPWSGLEQLANAVWNKKDIRMGCSDIFVKHCYGSSNYDLKVKFESAIRSWFKKGETESRCTIKLDLSKGAKENNTASGQLRLMEARNTDIPLVSFTSKASTDYFNHTAIMNIVREIVKIRIEEREGLIEPDRLFELMMLANVSFIFKEEKANEHMAIYYDSLGIYRYDSRTDRTETFRMSAGFKNDLLRVTKASFSGREVTYVLNSKEILWRKTKPNIVTPLLLN